MTNTSHKRHLHDISKFLALIARFKSVSSVTALAETIVAVCEELIPGDSIGCYMIDPETPREGIKLLANRGFSEEEVVWAAKSAFHRHPGIVMKSKKPLLIKDTDHEQLENISTTSPRKMKVRSRAWVPIIFNKEAIGSFGIASQKRDSFTEYDIELLEFVSYLSQVTYDVLLRSHRYRKEKERTNEQIKERSTFFAFINHEIRNPINAILGFSEILKEEDLTERQKKYISNIYKAGNNLLRLTNDLSDLSKLSADKMELIEGDLNLREIIEEIIDLYSLDAEQKNICFSYYISEDADCCFKGDTDRLKQVISNLVSNSIKFTNEGEIAIVVSATHDFHTKSKIHVDIFDTGIGIKEEDIPKLFREYSQLQNSNKDNVKGTGLGLNLSQKLVTLMGGNIHVRSDYNIGSNFSFNIFLEKH